MGFNIDLHEYSMCKAREFELWEIQSYWRYLWDLF